ncbi:choline dehydrogenase, mitochondrial-like [Mytilus galloprovincialis]|uniref:choline dehydrogenase, mitochondrial-like n=1 Tax=Mytilus galloprovincialis TaxID=29158 RepID=UPI003F7C9684
MVLLERKSDPPGVYDKPFKEMYDYIVGAGSAGSVVAFRLSEEYDTSVLLLEAGMSDMEPDDVTQIPSLWALRGLHGPINIKETTESILQSFHQTAAKEIGFSTVDCNSDDPIGFCKNQMNVKDGKRCSTSTCYLRPVLERHNLQVSLRSRVTKVLIRSNKAVGVEFIKDGKRRRIFAKHEVILSAGFIRSAQILMLSGIGPRKHLQQMKIPLTVDLPVGQNLYDHLLFAVQYNITAPLSINNKKASEPDDKIYIWCTSSDFKCLALSVPDEIV